MTGILIFLSQAQTHQCTIKFHCQNEEVLGGLLLLVAFSQPIGDPYKWSGSIVELWWEGRGLSDTFMFSASLNIKQSSNVPSCSQFKKEII